HDRLDPGHRGDRTTRHVAGHRLTIGRLPACRTTSRRDTAAGRHPSTASVSEATRWSPTRSSADDRRHAAPGLGPGRLAVTAQPSGTLGIASVLPDVRVGRSAMEERRTTLTRPEQVPSTPIWPVRRPFLTGLTLGTSARCGEDRGSDMWWETLSAVLIAIAASWAALIVALAVVRPEGP